MMKSPIPLQTNVAITLIITGVILILAPYIHSLFMVNHLATLMATTEKTVNLRSSLSSEYETAAFIAGAILCLFGIVGSIKNQEE